MRLILIITAKGRSEPLLKSCREHKLLNPVTFLGKGTAPTEILEALSLADSDKDVVFSFANKEDVPSIFEHLEEKFQFTKKGRGVACALNLNGISSATLEYLKQELKEINP